MSEKDLIYYSFDPFRDIQKGMQIVDEQGFSKHTSFEDIESFSNERGKPYNWMGYNSASSQSKADQFDIKKGLTQYLDNDLLKEINEVYDNVKAEIDLGGNILPSRMKFSDRPTGVFDFGQASKGLIRPVEFYCLEEEKLIPADNILREKIKNIDFYYHLQNGKKIYVQRRQEGTTKMISGCKDLKLEEEPLTKIFLPYKDGKIINECKGNRLRYASTNTKVYAYKTKVGGGITPYVDLYIATGGIASQTPESMVIRSLPNLLLARVLERAGVKVRIFILWSTGSQTQNYHIAMMVKNYGESISSNELAILTSDTRFYRYWLSISAKGLMYEKYGINVPVFEGTGTFSTSVIEDYTMPRIRNLTEYEINRGTFPSQLVDRKLILFTKLDAEPSWKVGDRDVMDRIKERFMEYIDYVSIQFGVNKSRVINEINNRMLENGKSKTEIRNHLTNAVSSVLNTTRRFESTYRLSSGSQYRNQATINEIEDDFKNGVIEEKRYRLLMDNEIINDTKEQADKTLDARDEIYELINNIVK